jgi:DNA-binding NarL/FixJ family response regulator
MDKIRILLADDHVVVMEGTRQLLERESDFQVVGGARDGEEAVKLATELKPDVIIMDIAMPKLNGIEATKAIKARLPSTAVLALTAYDYDEYILALVEAGAAGYLLKSVSGDRLVAAVRAVYAGEPVLHPVILRKLMDKLKPRDARLTEARPLEVISEREMEVLKMAAQVLSNKEIADKLSISVRTVQAHLRSIFNKLGVGSRSEAVLYALKKGWFSLDDMP